MGKLGSKTVFTAVPREDVDGWRGQTGGDLLGVVQAERPAGIKQDAIDWTSTLLQPTHISLASSGFWASWFLVFLSHCIPIAFSVSLSIFVLLRLPLPEYTV